MQDTGVAKQWVVGGFTKYRQGPLSEEELVAILSLVKLPDGRELTLSAVSK